MNKRKLAICMRDLEYQARFVNCFMNHYKHQYEVHVFTNQEELKLASPLEFAVIIIGEYNTDEIADFVERGEIILVLTENKQEKRDKEHFENLYFSEKYQEVYKIAEFLSQLIEEKTEGQNWSNRSTSCKWTGIYSLSKTAYQLPFSSLLARIYGENERILLLDLQSYSGLRLCKEDDHMGLEDLLSIATIGSYSKGRILECIGHEANWNYVYPVKNSQCLMEGSLELYERIKDTLEKELGYERIIVNFGVMFSGEIDMMERCDNVYLLCEKEEQNSWREEAFLKEQRESGKEELCKKIQKIEVPRIALVDGHWEEIAEKWYWSSFGETIRCRLREEQNHERAM